MQRLLFGLALALASISLSACASEDADGDATGTSAAGTGATTASDGTASPGLEDRATEIARFAFETPLEIEAGTAISWTNTEEPHTVTARDGSFDSGSIPQGGTFSHRFDTPGTYEYFCAIHPSMEGTVVVE